MYRRRPSGIRVGIVLHASQDGTIQIRSFQQPINRRAGIVVDSVPESEHQESQRMARVLIRAAEEAVKFAQGSAQGQ